MEMRPKKLEPISKGLNHKRIFQKQLRRKFTSWLREPALPGNVEFLESALNYHRSLSK